MVWLTIKEAAELLGYEESTVRKKAKNKEYHHRYIPSSTGQGGKHMEISLESLPDQAQRAYHNQTTGDAQTVFNTDYASTKEQRRKGESRALAVAEYRKFLKQSKKAGMAKKTEIMGLFVEQWNRDHDFQISKKSLYDWMKKSKSGQVEKLVDRRGGYNRGQSTIPKKYRDMFNSLYLRQTKPTIESCYREVKLNANMNGDFIPGIKAFRNHVKNMSEIVLVLGREGNKAFEDKCVPYIERDYSQLAPNQLWVADHHLWDIFVRIPDGKGGWKLARPWGSYWMDVRTRKIMSSIIRTEAPNADIVLCSFGMGIEAFGVPGGVLLDNGKDYKASDLFNNDNEKAFTSLSANLQIDVTYAKPYNGKAKPIERVFNTFEGQLGKMYPSYAGRNAKQRPEDLKDLDIMDVITLEEFIEHHKRYVYEIYNETGHSGDSMYGMSPNQIYKQLLHDFRKATDAELRFCLMRVKGFRVVQNNGVTFGGIHYSHKDLTEYQGRKVLAKYNPGVPGELYIFDENENFLLVALKIEKRWGMDAEDYRRENEKKKIARQKAQNAYTADNVIRSTESIGERLKRQADSIDRAGIAEPKVINLVRNSKAEENYRRASMADIDRRHEDAIRQNAARKKAVPDSQKECIDKFKKKMLDRAYQKQA